MGNGVAELGKLAIAWLAPLVLIVIVAIRFAQQSRRRRAERERVRDTGARIRMRRLDRAITDPAQIDAILSSATVGRLGFAVRDEPYVVPLSFGVADLVATEMIHDELLARFVSRAGGACRVYFHGAAEGRKLEMARRNPRVCFEVEGEPETVRHDDACEWSVMYESVIGYGTVSFVTDPEEKVFGLSCIMRHHGDEGPHEFPSATLDRTTLLRLDLVELTGKSNLRADAG